MSFAAGLVDPVGLLLMLIFQMNPDFDHIIYYISDHSTSVCVTTAVPL